MTGYNWDRSDTHDVGKAILIAGLSALLVKLAEWSVEALREKTETAEKEEATNAAD